ncbi:hypothetical protein ACQJBY_038806 [Aegilops geniculata]
MAAGGLPSQPSAPPPLSPIDLDDLLTEILLRLPPLPSSLPRASAVCRRWRRLICDPVFFRRFCLHHRRSPPILGFFVGRRPLCFSPTLEVRNRVPRERFFLDNGGDDDEIIDCRHGLVLILLGDGDRILVWEPLTGQQHRIAAPQHLRGLAPIHGAVLRLAWDDEQFQVVLVGLEVARANALFYSSKNMVWKKLVSPLLSGKDPFSAPPTISFRNSPPVLVRNSIHWLVYDRLSLSEVMDGVPLANSLVEFDVRTHDLSVARVVGDINSMTDYQILVIPEEGAVSLLTLSGLCAHIWRRLTDCDADNCWVITRSIDLNIRLPIDPQRHAGRVIIRGLAEYNRMLLLSSASRLFALQLDTFRYDKFRDSGCWYHPFESYCRSDPSMHTACPGSIKPEENQTAKAALEVGSSCVSGDSRFTRLMKECDDRIAEEASQVLVTTFSESITVGTATEDQDGANLEKTQLTVEIPKESPNTETVTGDGDDS